MFCNGITHLQRYVREQAFQIYDISISSRYNNNNCYYKYVYIIFFYSNDIPRQEFLSIILYYTPS